MEQTLASMMFTLAAFEGLEAVDIEAYERRVVTIQYFHMLDGHRERGSCLCPILLDGPSKEENSTRVVHTSCQPWARFRFERNSRMGALRNAVCQIQPLAKKR